MLAVILAGGFGTRLMPYTSSLPKPMLPIKNKPLLEYLIDWLKKYGVDSIVLCISYLKELIRKYFKDGRKFNINIKYAISDRPMLTAGQLKTAEKFIDGRFICLYGDTIYNFNLQSMFNQHKKKHSFITIGTYKHKISLEYGIINTTNTGRVISWKEKPKINANINIGCYIFEHSILNLIPNNEKFGMNQVIKKALIKKNQ